MLIIKIIFDPYVKGTQSNWPFPKNLGKSALNLPCDNTIDSHIQDILAASILRQPYRKT